TVDEASSALGLARALTKHARVSSICEELQRGLYAVGAELGTNPEAGKTFVTTGKAEVERLEQLIGELEGEVKMPEGFILPGTTPASGGLDLARASTRPAERHCVPPERGGAVPSADTRR